MEPRRSKPDAPVVLLCGLAEEVAKALEQRLPNASIRLMTDAKATSRELRENGEAVVVVAGGHDGDRCEQLANRWQHKQCRLIVVNADDQPKLRQLLAHRPDTAVLSTHSSEDIAQAIEELLHSGATETTTERGPTVPDDAAAGPPDELATLIRRVWEQVRETEMERLAVLEEAATALLELRLDEELRSRAETAAHRMAGVGTFGFATASKIAREIELMLMQPGPAATQVFVLSEKVVALGNELQQEPQPGPPSAAAERHDPLVLIIDRDEEETGRLVHAAAVADWRVALGSAFGEAWRILEEQHPSIILLNLTMTGRVGDGVRFLTDLSARRNPVPVVVLTDPGVEIDRADVARMGGRGFFQKPLLPAEIFHWINSTVRARVEEAEVVTISTDEEVTGKLRRILEPRQIRQRVIVDFDENSWREHTAIPYAVVIDKDSLREAASKIVEGIRALPGWGNVAILILSSTPQAHFSDGSLVSEYDDVLQKPLTEQQILARLVRPVEQSRALRRMAETDPITETPNRPVLEDSISRYLQMSERHGVPFTLALLDIDHFKQINRDYGPKAGHLVLRKLAELLRSSFRREDVIGRWGDDEFAVGVYALTSRDVLDRVSNIVMLLREHTFRAPDGHDFRVTLSCGLASSPTDGRNLQTLYNAADRALQRAREQGPDHAAAAGVSTERKLNVEAVDVALVEDDEALGSLLIQTLHLKGYRTAWFKDGRQAVDALSGASSTVDARVILLDVDLPGLDGLSVLQRLARYGIQRRSRVIMLTVRSGEAEVLTAFKLGAFDHVGKPFSMPILAERIRRAMES